MIRVRFRVAEPDDRTFIVSTWSSSYKASHYAGLIMSEDWASVMHVQIGKLIDRPKTTTIVAHAPPDFLYGFIAGDVSGALPIVHYVYVKDAFRSEPLADGTRWGPRIARGLFTALGVDPALPFLYTCSTPLVASLKGKIPRARFVPAAARYINYQVRP